MKIIIDIILTCILIVSYEGSGECDHRAPGVEADMFTLKLHCPGLTSLRWVVRLYSLVLGGLGVILSFTWVCFHLYVLSMTSLMELRQHRSGQTVWLNAGKSVKSWRKKSEYANELNFGKFYEFRLWVISHFNRNYFQSIFLFERINEELKKSVNASK